LFFKEEQHLRAHELRKAFLRMVRGAVTSKEFNLAHGTAPEKREGAKLAEQRNRKTTQGTAACILTQ